MIFSFILLPIAAYLNLFINQFLGYSINHRPGLIKRIVALLKCRNKKYTQEDVETILSAFWDVVIEAISSGDSINLNGYAITDNGLI